MRRVDNAVNHHHENHAEKSKHHAFRQRVVVELRRYRILLCFHIRKEEENVQANNELNQEKPHVEVLARFLLFNQRENALKELVIPKDRRKFVHKASCLSEKSFLFRCLETRLTNGIGT